MTRAREPDFLLPPPWRGRAGERGILGSGQHLFQGLGGEHPLGPEQQGVGVARFDALLDGEGQVAKAEA